MLVSRCNEFFLATLIRTEVILANGTLYKSHLCTAVAVILVIDGLRFFETAGTTRL
jgi:hypothetical protein